MQKLNAYYANKLDSLRDIFGAEVVKLQGEKLVVDGQYFPIVDDVIVMLAPGQFPPNLIGRLSGEPDDAENEIEFASDIQFTFGHEWQIFPEILPEHKREFLQYFDVVDLEGLRGERVCDLGCGIGRWSYFLREYARELVLVDFSEAIFVARRNLQNTPNAIFVMADVQRLPFRDDFADFVFCFGVLHHLPVSAIQTVREIARLAPRLLVYLYSALDARPMYYRLLLAPVNLVRRSVCRVHSNAFRRIFTYLATLTLYLPLIGIGHLVRPFGLSSYVPLYDFYHGKTMKRIRQDAYDRFFTRIEQRFSRNEIVSIENDFENVTISNQIPMWHFLCERSPLKREKPTR